MDAEFSPVELWYDLIQACPEFDALLDAWGRGEAELPPAIEQLNDQAIAQCKRDPFALQEVIYKRELQALHAELQRTRAALAEAEAQLQAATSAREPASGGRVEPNSDRSRASAEAGADVPCNKSSAPGKRADTARLAEVGSRNPQSEPARVEPFSDRAQVIAEAPADLSRNTSPAPGKRADTARLALGIGSRERAPPC